MLQAGKLRYPVIIESRTGAQDASGQVTFTWQTFANTFASIEELTGNERLISQQLFASVNVRMRIRYMPGVDSTMRVTYNSSQGAIHYVIAAVMDPDGLRQSLELMCIFRPDAQGNS